MISLFSISLDVAVLRSREKSRRNEEGRTRIGKCDNLLGIYLTHSGKQCNWLLIVLK